MTWKTGVAAGHLNFIDQLLDALTAQGHASGRAYAGTGNGTLTGPSGEVGGYVGGATTVAETFTLTATSATSFTVVGSVSGSLPAATVGQAYDQPQLKFRLNAGSTAFAAGDQFKLSTTPPWQVVRRFGAPRSGLSSTFNNGERLWDGVVTQGVGDNSTASASALPASATMAMIGASPVGLVSISTGNDIGANPTAFRLEYSDNGSAWSVAQSWAGVEMTARETRTFAVTQHSAAHRYWRLVFTAYAQGGDHLELSEIRMFRGPTSAIELSRFAEVVVAGPGADGQDSIYIGWEVYEDAALAARSFNFYHFRAFNPAVAVRDQPSNSGLRNVPLTSNNFTWWLAINGRRFAGTAKIGAVYVPLYQGLGKPYELPTVHPYPAINGGTSNNEAGVATSISPNFRGFSCPGRYGLVVRYPDNAWRQHANRYDIGSDVGDDQTPGKVYPTSMNESGRFPDFRENLDGTRTLYELVLASTNPRHLWGEFDGCYFTPGFNLVPEQTITQDGHAHMVFQNTFRNAEADFFAIRQD